jgi:CspA family cold shock protein
VTGLFFSKARAFRSGDNASIVVRSPQRFEERNILMATGTVKWFNPAKGFGFIQPDQGGADVFVHISALEGTGLKTLNEGQRVSYELATQRGKTAAANIQIAA